MIGEIKMIIAVERKEGSMNNDVISRQEAIDAIRASASKYTGFMEMEMYTDDDAVEAINGVPSAQQWIPCKERLPENLEEVNVTWVNHDPEPYYVFFKDKPATATAVYYKEKWYWYSSTCVDFLAEYGGNPNDEIDDGIEITAWMPLPEPWRGEEDETD